MIAVGSFKTSSDKKMKKIKYKVCINFVYRFYVRIVIKITIECKDKPITF